MLRFKKFVRLFGHGWPYAANAWMH